MLVEVPYHIVHPFQYVARQDRVTICDTQHKTHWFTYIQDAEIVGVGGFLILNEQVTNGRIKGIWVKPEHRNKGIGERIADELIDLAINRFKVNEIEVFAYNSKFYARRGFIEYGVRPTGSTIMRKKLDA